MTSVGIFKNGIAQVGVSYELEIVSFSGYASTVYLAFTDGITTWADLTGLNHNGIYTFPRMGYIEDYAAATITENAQGWDQLISSGPVPGDKGFQYKLGTNLGFGNIDSYIYKPLGVKDWAAEGFLIGDLCYYSE